MFLTLQFDFIDNILNIIDNIFYIAANVWYSKCGDT